LVSSKTKDKSKKIKVEPGVKNLPQWANIATESVFSDGKEE
jgi:hypothetical protein